MLGKVIEGAVGLQQSGWWPKGQPHKRAAHPLRAMPGAAVAPGLSRDSCAAPSAGGPLLLAPSCVSAVALLVRVICGETVRDLEPRMRAMSCVRSPKWSGRCPT